MGIGYTIDTPLKVSHLGIDSVISLVDDIILEKLRKMYCNKFEIPYKEITDKIDDFRAKRITSYLNLINNLAEKKFEDFKSSSAEKMNELKAYFTMLPDASDIKKEFSTMAENFNFNEVGNWFKDKLSMGSIDVNIMTKVDKDNYKNGEQLPTEFNDAHAALRGFANSDLQSSVILSAGMNPRLYSYLEKFDDFFPDEKGFIKKKIVLKVSDYRSALIQGKFLAKKGIWVSEFRIESGLNCGGHAFASDGFLMGPILSEFKNKRADMIEELSNILFQALEVKSRIIPNSPLHLKITAQGGVGTSEEHQFLLDQYDLDSIGWGTPFLLVPEAVNIDKPTLNMLQDAKEEDLFLSGISPLGVPFNSLRGNTKDVERNALIAKGRPGSSCPKKFVALNKEFSDKGMCTASREYQYFKLKELDQLGLPEMQYKMEHNKIVEKSCTCVGLGTSALLVNNLDTKVEGEGVSICPGPNMAYFSKTMKLTEIIDHIYGRTRDFIDDNRPNMFVKEFNIYIDYLKDKIEEASVSMTKKQEKYLMNFVNNMEEGAHYYNHLFEDMKDRFEETKTGLLKDFDNGLSVLATMKEKIVKLSPVKVK
jgi:hypothetical protein